jgi:Zn finger protein HypA/HybF involved in hydrogenase expression
MFLPYICDDCRCEFSSALPVDALCPECGSDNTRVDD